MTDPYKFWQAQRADVRRAIRVQLGIGDADIALIQFIYTAKQGGHAHAMRTTMWFLLGESFR